MIARHLTLATLLLAGCAGIRSDIEVPEPMVFDLVRGLGASKGELEVNALAILPLSNGDPAAPEIAPEIEYAFQDGLALELELPFEDDGLYSIKAAGQWTIGDVPEKGFIHGTQVIVERLIEEDVWDLSLLYLPAFRFDEKWSTQMMFGVRGLVGSDVSDDIGALANATLFRDLNPKWTLGLEIDSVLMADTGSSVLIMPQAHWEFSEHGTLQFGVGVSYIDGSITAGTDLLIPPAHGWFPQFALRLIFEF